MYEPHLDHQGHHPSPHGEGLSLLEELDKIAPIKAFDAFPKVQSTYTVRSRRGGILTTVVAIVIFFLILNDLGEYLYGAPGYSFQVDHGLERDLQLNIDLTVAMPCHYLTIDLRDAVGDRLHLSDDFAKDGTVFELGKARSIKSVGMPTTGQSASDIITSSRRKTPNQRKTLSGIRKMFTTQTDDKHQLHHRQLQANYRATANKIDNGPACRIYGSVEVKKVTANLHITTLGHGYMSFEHTDHELMNLTHVIHEFSFGPFFPAISQPLDMSYELTSEPFTISQYFLRIIPTTYIDSSRRRLTTSQYAVTDYSRSFKHGEGVPGIFFKFDIEPMQVVIHERTTSLYHFLIRLAGVVGGVWTVAGFGLRVINRAHKEVTKVVGNENEIIPSSLSIPLGGERGGRSSEFGGSSIFGKLSPGSRGPLDRANSWLSSGSASQGMNLNSGDWKGR